MSTTLTDQIFAGLAEFSSASRLYELKIGDREETGLLVEAFLAQDGVQEVGTRDVIALSTDAYLELDSLLGQTATLEISLADGKRERFGGEVCEAAMLGSDGGLARYRIRMSSWLWRLGQVRNCRVWQDKSVIEIVDAVFEAYQPLARWRWSEDAGSFLEEVSPRSYCCQYRESDLDFISRLLAEEGLCWRIEQTEDGPGVVLFADSSQLSAVPEDPSSEAQGGIRFHGARAVEESDSIQALSAQRRLHASLMTVLSYDYKSKQAIAASSPSHYTCGSKLPVLESYEVPGQYAYADRQQAQHYADLRMQEQEARGQMWHGRSTVRTLRAGTRMQVLGAPLQQLSESASFTVLRVLSIGVNNMPPSAQHALAELFGPIPELLEELTWKDMPEDLELAIAQARETGYANCFSAVASEIIWRPSLERVSGRSYPKPVVFGAQSAIVVGADGNDQPSGADELYCDSMGRLRIRFHWQDIGNATCWVRVAQRSAGGDMGQQFLPRIGQEVLVQFLENDVDRPVIVGALYNGRGEGGIATTPGGRHDSETDISCFEAAHDHATSGQANVSGGSSPVWHGASSDSAGHRNSTSKWGIRSKEFGGYGYSQLLFDEVDSQGQVHLKNTYSGSELSLGHLIHAADNYRGSLRGIGTELRTDAFGVVRAGAGLSVTTYKLNHNNRAREPVGVGGVTASLVEQTTALSEAFNSCADKHQTVRLAAYLGTAISGKSAEFPKIPPLKAVLTSLSGRSSNESVEAALRDTGVRNTKPDDGKIPNLTDPLIAMVASDGVGINAGQSVQLETDEITFLSSGRDVQFIAGEQMRLQSAQAIGILSSTIEKSSANLGLRMIASKGLVDIQSQRDEVKVSSKDTLTIISVNDLCELVASKTIILATAGGASITIGNGNITVQCPNKVLIRAGIKSFTGPKKIGYEMPILPQEPFDTKKVYPFSL